MTKCPQCGKDVDEHSETQLYVCLLRLSKIWSEMKR